MQGFNLILIILSNSFKQTLFLNIRKISLIFPLGVNLAHGFQLLYVFLENALNLIFVLISMQKFIQRQCQIKNEFSSLI